MDATPNPGVIVGFLFLLPSLFFFARAAEKCSLARRFAYVGLGCGMLMFFPVEYVTGWNPVTNRTGFIALVGLRILFGMFGCAVGILALLLRRRQQPPDVGRALCITAIVLSSGELLMGAGFSFAAFRLAPSAPEKHWIYHSAKHDFDLTLPSRDWRLANVDGAKEWFARPGRPMQVKLQFADFPGGVPWDMLIESQRSRFNDSSNPLDLVVEELGETYDGDRFRFAVGLEKRSRVYVGHTLIWRKKSDDVVEILFEAKLTALSETMRNVEQQGAIADARVVCYPRNAISPAPTAAASK